jgi:outer membrane protein OmpA-like peptidoglycan-associated protein
MKSILGSTLAALLLVSVPAGFAQVPNPTQVEVQRAGDNPLYRVTINVVERNIKAVNYRVRGGSTKIDFKGTALLPDAKGDAYIESKKGYIDVNAEFEKLQPASRFGPEYLTYVLWAVTPEGRATNVGELILDGSESNVHVTTELQAFGLIVTAEPYFAVTQPSDVVVLENFIRKDTEGSVKEIDAKFDLLKRGQYVVNAVPADLKPFPLDEKTPLDLAQARNALRIADWSGAATSAADTYQKARMLLDQAETQQSKKASKKTISTTAREAVQVAEDARLLTLKRQEEARLAAERQASLARESAARSQAEQESRLRAEADAASRLEIERRARAEAEERAARERAEAARLEAANARADADRAKAEADLAKTAANRSNEEARLAQQKAESQAQEARLAAQRAEQEKAELRANLMKQLNLILETRDSARGLIVNMSDVLFDTAQHTLKPGAREKLSKVSGILLSHPGLSLEIEGHTDSVGSDDYNQSLSERRAESVKSYLAQQGIPSATIKARGFGEAQPVASNDTAAGRQRNRRVELIVSGELIGTTVQATLQ